MDWLFYGLGDLIESTFDIIPVIGESLNKFLIIVIMALTVYWLIEMYKYYKQGERY